MTLPLSGTLRLAWSFPDRQWHYYASWRCLCVFFRCSFGAPCLKLPSLKLLSQAQLLESGSRPCSCNVHPLMVNSAGRAVLWVGCAPDCRADKSALAFDGMYSSQMMTTHFFFEAAYSIITGCYCKPVPKTANSNGKEFSTLRSPLAVVVLFCIH